MIAYPILWFAGGVLVIVLLIAAALILKIAMRENDAGEPGRLHFAAVILTGIGLLFFMAMAMYYFDGYDLSSGARVASNGGTVGKSIFEACVQVLPPIVTLVLGYYFGRREGA
jgi:NO-binding membrane sensor protein with MHYT domain